MLKFAGTVHRQPKVNILVLMMIIMVDGFGFGMAIYSCHAFVSLLYAYVTGGQMSGAISLRYYLWYFVSPKAQQKKRKEKKHRAYVRADGHRWAKQEIICARIRIYGSCAALCFYAALLFFA